VLQGFARKPRSLPCRFLYDARGSELFEEITQLDEYYPTRMETALLKEHGAEIAELMGDASVLVEFGSGSSRKTSLLLDAVDSVKLYIPIDVSSDSLAKAAERLIGRHDGACHSSAHRRLHHRQRLARGGAVPPQAWLLLRLDHRQFEPGRGENLSRPCCATIGEGKHFSHRRRFEEGSVDSDPSL
jgi:Histidine-specific methyltransferase, SAM-dependent